MKIKKVGSVIVGLALLFLLPGLAAADTARYNVLVVMSYGPDYEFVQKVRQGIESVLSDNCRIQYFYMDTKKNLAGGPQKAKAAYALYKKTRPDGVIAADDNAQSMFVVPHLKDKVSTPVMFCGVNEPPDKYGYPASNVSGILERITISQSLAFAKQLIPSISTFGYMTYDSPTGRSILEYFQQEEHTFPIELAAARFPKTLAEARSMARELSSLCDVLFVPTMQGTKDDNGTPLSDKQVVPVLVNTFAKPVVGDHKHIIRYGMLCGMAQHTQEQGFTAAKMLFKAMSGTPVSEIPITCNRQGKPIINVTAMKAFGIKPRPILLKSTELVHTVP